VKTPRVLADPNRAGVFSGPGVFFERKAPLAILRFDSVYVPEMAS
jgi:hypothetical protein